MSSPRATPTWRRLSGSAPAAASGVRRPVSGMRSGRVDRAGAHAVPRPAARPARGMPARYVSRSKVHHRDCYLLRNPAVQTAPLGNIAHRPYCSVCDGPGFGLTDDHLDYLWAVMAVNDITDPATGLLRRSRGPDGPATAEEWRQERRDELAACEHVIAAMARPGRSQPRIALPTGDVILRTRYQGDRIEAALAAGPGPGELASGSAPVPGRTPCWPPPPARAALPGYGGWGRPAVAGAPVPGQPDGALEEEKRAVRVIDTPRARDRVLSPAYVCGITHQRIELAQAVTAAGRVRGDPALAHPVWGASYEWMAPRLHREAPALSGTRPHLGHRHQLHRPRRVRLLLRRRPAACDLSTRTRGTRPCSSRSPRSGCWCRTGLAGTSSFSAGTSRSTRPTPPRSARCSPAGSALLSRRPGPGRRTCWRRPRASLDPVPAGEPRRVPADR